MFILKIPIKYIIKPTGPVGAGPVPVGAGPVPVGAGLGQSLPVGPGADRYRPVLTVAGAAEGPQETLFLKKVILSI